ncbi:transcription elongation factor TFIIS [Basidiobolus ranarum]|uniref:Transcription elongation factor TFIIS n=1 Tax=Basidiobolus ranarum TaxID=34480 RepID=A0ABR2WJ78_9FUNG
MNHLLESYKIRNRLRILHCSLSLARMNLSTDTVRKKGIDMIFGALKEDRLASDKQETQLLDKAMRIEEGIFNEEHNTSHNYRSKIRSKVLNLKDPTNPDLRRSIILGDISVEQFSEMNSEDMASEQRKQENARIRRDSLKNSIGIDNLKPKGSEENEEDGALEQQKQAIN